MMLIYLSVYLFYVIGRFFWYEWCMLVCNQRFNAYFDSKFMIVHRFYCFREYICILRLSIQCLLVILPVLHLNKGSSMSFVHASIERRHCYRVLWPLKSLPVDRPNTDQLKRRPLVPKSNLLRIGYYSREVD